MEAKLKEYRALRRRKEILENAKDKIDQTKNKLVDFLTPKFLKEMDNQKDEEVLLMENEETPEILPPPLLQDLDVASETGDEDSSEEEPVVSWKYFILKWTAYTMLWLSFYIYFLKIQFGAVFFGVSILVGICLNTRTRPRKKGEVSAYSVFNRNCASIDGTVKAEQLQREMMFGAFR